MDPEQFQQKLTEKDQKILSLQKELELKNQCLSLITHDFAGVSRNLLWVIEALKDGSIDLEIFQTLYEELKSAAETNQKIISNTIAWINSQESEFLPKTELLPVTDLFAYIENAVRTDIERKQIRFQQAGAADLSVRADRILLQFILKALVENAIKYSPHGAPVIFRVSPDEDSAVLSVEDMGVGMSSALMDDLFSFRTSPYTGTDGEKGAGLSLIVAKKFAILQHSDLHVSSEEGSGTKIEMKLPIH
jgi:signal transduction histidine kinase